MKPLIEYLFEAQNIDRYNRKFEFEFIVAKSHHACGRQSRHGEDDRNYISDEEIAETIRQAIDRIMVDIVNNHIRIRGKFVVRDANTDLNIVCGLNPGTAPNRLRIDIITVIRTDDFQNPQDSWVVMVR